MSMDVTPTGSGYSAEPEPSSTVSAVPVSIPNAGSMWLLWASQGEYSDRTEWPIALYTSKEEAEAAVVRGTALWNTMCGPDRFIAYDRQAEVKASPEYAEFAALTGVEPYLGYDEVSLTCCELDVRRPR